MVNKDLVNYLTEGRKRGFSIQLLKSKLLEGGFAESDVNEAIAVVEQKQKPLPSEMKKIDLFDKSQDKNYMPLEEKPKSFLGIQQKPEVKLEEKPMMMKSSGQGKWMKIGAILGIILLVIYAAGIVMNFVAKDILNSILQNNLTTLIIGVILVFMGAIYYYAFTKVGKKTDQKLLTLGAWFTIVPIVLYVVLGLVAAILVYQQAINFFSGVDDGGSYKIIFLVVSILWIVSLLLHLIGQILMAVGMVKAGKEVKFLRTAGILNIFVFLGSIGVLIGMIIFIYAILNAFSVGQTGSLDALGGVLGSASIAIWSFMSAFGVKFIARIFEIMSLFNASKRFE